MVENLASLALDGLDIGVVVCSERFERVEHRNDFALALWRRHRWPQAGLPPAVREMACAAMASRAAVGRFPPAVGVETTAGEILYLRLLSTGNDALVLLVISPGRARDAALFRHLNAELGVTRREFHVLSALRLGRTNRQVAAELGISEGRTAKLVSSLLEKLRVSNRVALVRRIDEIASAGVRLVALPEARTVREEGPAWGAALSGSV